MSELIDRQALLDKCLNHYEVGNIEQNCTMDWICKTVRNAPTASPWHRVEDGLPEMSECVVRMEMPKNNCEMAVEIKGAGDWCPIAARVCDYYSTKKMPDWCPIICSLPEGHGRLVDADALKAYLVAEAASYDLTQGQMGILSEAIDMIDEQPTIVPAERKDNGETC